MNIYFESQGLAGGGPGPGGRSGGGGGAVGVYSDDDSSDDDLELGAVRLTYKDNTNDDDHPLVPGSPGARAAELAELVYFADDPDELSINRCWRKSFKGATTGRRLKRLVCRFGTYQMLFGGGLMGIAAYETITYPLDEGWFAATTYGWSVRNLTWCVSFGSCFFSVLGSVAIVYWASLVTNRTLFRTLLQIYLFIFFLVFVVAGWTTCALFLTFMYLDYRKISPAVSPYTLYVASVSLLVPYLAALLYYILDLHYLLDELAVRGSVIKEPGRPKGVIDLTGVSIWNTCGMIFCAIPFMFIFQFFAIIDVIVDSLRTCCAARRDRHEKWVQGRKDRAEARAARKSTCCGRVCRTLRIWCCCGGCRWLSLRERMEARRLARERADAERRAREEEEERQRELAARALMDAERQLAEAEYRRRVREQEELERTRKAREERDKAEAERRKKEDAERQRRADDAARKEKEDEEARKNAFRAVLSMDEFKSKWAGQNPSGSFQCKLKVMPELVVLSNHLKKQGFHVCYSKDEHGEQEIGFCNVRKVEADPTFMCRFVVNNKSFNAVMKSTDAAAVPAFVKKFSLAKTLKIDTSK